MFKRKRALSRTVIYLILGGIIFAIAGVGLECWYTTQVTIPISSTVPTSASNLSPLNITIVYDNNEYNELLETAWGFSCLIKGLEKTILFDTGGDSSILLSNMHKLEINPEEIDVIIISHIRHDHVGGLPGFLEVNPEVAVYLPKSFPERIKREVRETNAELIEVSNQTEICENAYSTGELGTCIKEQSLIVKTEKGLVVVIGCADPGIEYIVKDVKSKFKEDVYMVLGGFYLSGIEQHQINEIINIIKNQGVAIIAPSHCSDDFATRLFERGYGENFILLGAGKRLQL
jgi:7,8-dihydropterin-6-yl-methyl-4-(beta-D-ribofuranosyl)aminobenzene 5'-phosphate synthase